MNRTSPADARSDADAASVTAPGRLHLGFLDPSGSLGRRFGSLGLVIEGQDTHVELSRSEADRVVPLLPRREADVARARRLLQLLREHSGRGDPVLLRLVALPAAHAGFGSGTQLALAVGRAFVALHGLDVTTAALARWLGRGLRSGIGIAGFDQGGLLVDGGHGSGGGPAPIVARCDFPLAWRVVVIEDPRLQGLSGSDEKAALDRLGPLPRAAAADLCHQVLLQVLPGAAQAQFDTFAHGLNRIQDVLGEHFAAAQGGSAFTSPAVGRAVGWMRRHAGPDGAAVGQSSWGPTGFAVLPGAHEAQALIDAARHAGMLDAALRVQVVGARNRGAQIAAPSRGRAPAQNPGTE